MWRFPEYRLLLQPHPPCHLQPCGGERAHAATPPVQERLYRHGEDRQEGDTVRGCQEDKGTRPFAETVTGFCEGHVPLLVLHPWDVVRGHGLFEEIRPEERDVVLPQEEDGAAVAYKVGTVYAGNRGETSQHDHGIPAAHNNRPDRFRQKAV